MRLAWHFFLGIFFCASLALGCGSDGHSAASGVKKGTEENTGPPVNVKGGGKQRKQIGQPPPPGPPPP
jgi:hypothetical protein